MNIEGWTLLPVRIDACPACGMYPPHAPHQPHDCSMFFRYWWKANHGRWGTWKDAVAHCTPAVRAAWERELRARNAWSEPEETS